MGLVDDMIYRTCPFYTKAILSDKERLKHRIKYADIWSKIHYACKPKQIDHNLDSGKTDEWDW